jgi:hypothetical protein
VTVTAGATSVSGTLPPGGGVGLAVQVVAGQLPAHQADVVVDGRDYELDGSLSSAVRPGVWRQQGSVDDYSLFVRIRPPTPVYAIAHAGTPDPRVTVLSNGANSESVRLRAATPVVVVRDVAWDGGWHASVSSDGGPSRPVTVRDHNLVQEVRLPAGTDVVTFKYGPPHWLVASVLSGASLLLLATLLVIAVRRRARRGPGGNAPPTAPPVATPDHEPEPEPEPTSMST